MLENGVKKKNVGMSVKKCDYTVSDKLSSELVDVGYTSAKATPNSSIDSLTEDEQKLLIRRLLFLRKHGWLFQDGQKKPIIFSHGLEVCFFQWVLWSAAAGNLV